MGHVAEVARAEQMPTAGQVERGLGLALRVQRYSCQRLALVADRNCTGCGQAIFAGYGNRNGRLRPAVQVARLCAQRGLRGLCLLALSQGQRGHRQRNTQSCNQFKPQTAAD